MKNVSNVTTLDMGPNYLSTGKKTTRPPKSNAFYYVNIYYDTSQLFKKFLDDFF